MHAPVAPMVSAAGMTNDGYGDLLRGIVLQWASDYRFGQQVEVARNSDFYPWPIRKETQEVAASPEFWELCAAVGLDADVVVKRLEER